MVRKHVLRNKEIYIHRADEAEKVLRGEQYSNAAVKLYRHYSPVNYNTLTNLIDEKYLQAV